MSKFSVLKSRYSSIFHVFVWYQAPWWSSKCVLSLPGGSWSLLPVDSTPKVQLTSSPLDCGTIYTQNLIPSIIELRLDGTNVTISSVASILPPNKHPSICLHSPHSPPTSDSKIFTTPVGLEIGIVRMMHKNVILKKRKTDDSPWVFANNEIGCKKNNILSWAQWEILDNLGGCFTCHKITFQIIPKRKSRSKTGQQCLGHIFKITNYWIWLADIGCIFCEWYLRVYWW